MRFRLNILLPAIVIMGWLDYPLLSQTSCVESAFITATPVQCNTFRNGTIMIDSVRGGTLPYSYSIDGTTFSTRPLFDLLWPGIYTITIRDANGCEYQQTTAVEEPEVLKVQLFASQTSAIIGQPLDLSAKVSPTTATIVAIRWRPTEYFEDGIKFEQHINGLEQSTTFAVEVEDQNECTARAQITVEINVPNIFVPNVISIGSNLDAYFTVFSDEYLRSVKSLRIFSRAGDLVFQRTNFPPNDPLQGWNGRYNSQRAQPGVFAWVAELEYFDGSINVRSGSLTVVR